MHSLQVACAGDDAVDKESKQAEEAKHVADGAGFADALGIEEGVEDTAQGEDNDGNEMHPQVALGGGGDHKDVRPYDDEAGNNILQICREGGRGEGGASVGVG